MFSGEIIFDIADSGHIDVDFGPELIPTKIVSRGDMIALGRKAPKNRWVYKVTYNGEMEYIESLNKMVAQLCNKREYVNELSEIYEEVSINVYMRSEFAEIGYSIPNQILKKLALINCTLNFRILSFGMAIND